MIPEEFKQDVVKNGLAFVRAITNCYGAETGMALWSQIAEVLDPNVKGEMLFAMIIGGESDTVVDAVTVDHIAPSKLNNTLRMVRAIRTVTGCSLQEARNQVDLLRMNVPVTLTVLPGTAAESKKTLQLAGAVI